MVFSRTLLKIVFPLSLWAVAMGCVQSRPRPFSDGFYIPPRIDRLSSSAGSVAVYLFTDKRDVADPKEIGWISTIRIHGPIHASEAVSTGVTRAFVKAFQVRGFDVIDKSDLRFTQEKPLPHVRTIVTGTILEFRDVLVRRGPFNYTRSGVCRIVVNAVHPITQQILWERTYRKSNASLAAPDNELFAECVAEAVEEVINDSELTAIINRAE